MLLLIVCNKLLFLYCKTKSGGDEYPDYSGSYEPVGSAKELQHYLVIYVNRELSLNPPLPVKGKALYDTCSDPVSLW